MKLHEYQAKALFAEVGIPVPRGKVVRTGAGARDVAVDLGCPVVLKAQVQVAGRGKAGGIQRAESPEEAQEKADALLSSELKGVPVRALLVERAAGIEHELYLGVTVDRAQRNLVILASARGGIDIEEVARENPEAIVRVNVDPLVGLRGFHARRVLGAVLPDAELMGQASRILQGLYDLFIDKDCSLVEINPLVVTDDGKLVALDAKILIDDNGLYRHPELEALRDPEAEDPREVQAKSAGLSYVPLEGSIGCVVNGAGLAMATMDLVQARGGWPANFLDVGGSSRPEKVVEALRIILGDAGVRVILFNIFGGITRCDDIAHGIQEGIEQLGVQIPIVARLTGTNEDVAREILSSANVIFASSMDEAVVKAVSLAGQAK